MKNSYFLSQPHQPFFLLSIVAAVVFMLEFALGYKGVLSLEVSSLFFHVYTLVFGMFFFAFTGFLFTTFPRFNQTEVIAKDYYVRVFLIAFAATLLLAVGAVVHKGVFIAGMVLLFGAQSLMVAKLYVIYKASRFPDKKDSFWILSGNIFGVVGHLLFLLYGFGVDALFASAVNVSVFLFALFTAFSVAQRMIPFFSHSFAAKNERFVPVVFAGFVLASLASVLEFKLLQGGVFFALAIYMGIEIKRWELHPLRSPAILWVLHLALFWLPLGFALYGLLAFVEVFFGVDFYYLGYHLLLIGFLTTVLIGFGTRVILGHSGNVPHADKVSIALFVLTQLVVLARMLYSFDIAFGWGKPFLFDIAFTLWLVVFVVWGVKFLRVLVLGKGK